MSIVSKRIDELFIEGETNLILNTLERIDSTEFQNLMNDICFMFHVFSHDLSKYSILAVESMKKF
jgi:hypothetical protein